MAERRYSFRFSLPEGCVLLLSLLLTSFLVFLFGVYVGKEVEAHKAIKQARTARLPASVSGEPSPARPTSDIPTTNSPVPAEKSQAPAAPPNPPAPPTLRNPPSSSNIAGAGGQKTSPPLLQNSEASVAVGPKPDSPAAPAASASVPPTLSSPSPSAVVATAPKPRP